MRFFKAVSECRYTRNIVMVTFVPSSQLGLLYGSSDGLGGLLLISLESKFESNQQFC